MAICVCILFPRCLLCYWILLASLGFEKHFINLMYYYYYSRTLELERLLTPSTQTGLLNIFWLVHQPKSWNLTTPAKPCMGQHQFNYIFLGLEQVSWEKSNHNVSQKLGTQQTKTDLLKLLQIKTHLWWADTKANRPTGMLVPINCSHFRSTSPHSSMCKSCLSCPGRCDPSIRGWLAKSLAPAYKAQTCPHCWCKVLLPYLPCWASN